MTSKDGKSKAEDRMLEIRTLINRFLASERGPYAAECIRLVWVELAELRRDINEIINQKYDMIPPRGMVK